MTQPYWQLPDWPNWLSAIRAAPDDDVTRLVVADWLDENGYGERAEFVRVQVAGQRCHPKLTWLVALEGPLSGQPHQWGRVSSAQTSRVVDLNNTECVFIRGFVHTVRAPLATLYGGECERCDGVGHLGLYSCPGCYLSTVGTGRTVGILPDLLRREPVLRVEVVDKCPRGWTWYDETRYSVVDDPESNLPKEIIGHLKGGHWDERNACFDFEDREAATDALSAALIEWGLGQIREGVNQ